jgi:GT2 family glycosyltransferase
MTVSNLFVDFVVVCYRNDPTDLEKLRSVLLDGASLFGESAQVTFVVNDDAELEPLVATRIIKGQGNVGFGAGINLGVRSSAARFVVMVNPDCEPEPEAIASFLAFLVPGCGLLTPLIVDAEGGIDYPLYEQWTFTPSRQVSAEVCRRALGRSKSVDQPIDLPRFVKLPGTFVGAETSVARMLDSPFSEDFFLYGEDRDLTVRARQTGVPVRLIPSVRVHHIGGVSGGGSEAISKCKADSLVRIAYRRYGRLGALLAIADMWAVSRTGRGQISPQAAAWAARRWGMGGGAAPPCSPETVGLAPSGVAS